ncbi:AAA family ATPase [Candidatus Auribacterota bacterium]
MYLRYFNLREAPFNLTPDPDFLFRSQTYSKAVNDLRDGIQRQKGFILVVGEVGAGKTTLCRSLFKELLNDKNIEIAVIFNSFLSPFELLKHINEDFLLSAKGETTEELIRELTEFLLHCKAEAKRVVVVIDESQNLSFEALEQIRMLSNLETTKEKLIQIVLVGQPEFYELLDDAKLRQLNQRITIRCNIKPLDKSEIKNYIEYRLKIASNEDNTIHFSKRAIDKIASFSKGIPRLINGVCENALLVAAKKETSFIDKGIVKKSLAKMKGLRVRKSRNVSTTGKFYFFSIFVSLAIFFYSIFHLITWYKNFTKEKDKKEKTDIFSMIVEYDEIVKKRDASVAKKSYQPPQLSAQDDQMSQIVFSSLEILKLWKYKRSLLEELWFLYQNRSEINFDTVGKNSGFYVSLLKIKPAMIRKLNMPLILKLFEEGNTINYGVVVGCNETNVFIRRLGEKTQILSYPELNKIWFGEAIVFSRSFGFSEKILFKGSVVSKREISYLQKLLLKTGFLTQNYTELKRKYDKPIETAVKKFQKKYSFPGDGMLTFEMKMLLYRVANDQDIPKIYHSEKEDK